MHKFIKMARIGGGGGNLTVSFGRVAFVATALCAALAPSSSWAADGIWIGGSSADLCEPGNWSGGEVPNGGIATISVDSAMTLTCSGEFSPSAIAFGVDSALVTIEGTGCVTNILAITNFSAGVHHVFSNSVFFAENAEADVNAASDSGNYVKYPGGMTAWTLKNADGPITNFLSGQITITKNIGDWSRFVNIGHLLLADEGTKLTIPHSVVYNTNPNFSIRSGTTVRIEGDLTSKIAAFAQVINGTLDVSGWVVKDNAINDVKFSVNNCDGYIKAYGIKEATSGQAKDFVWTSSDNTSFKSHFILGAGGIPSGTSTMMHDNNSGGGELITCFYAAEDYLVEGTIGLGYSTRSASRYPIWHIYTDDVDGTGGRTVTLNCTINGNTPHRAVRIYGTGTVKVLNDFSSPRKVEVYNTATLALTPEKSVAIELLMANYSTLKVRGSGIVDMTGCSSVKFAHATCGFAFHFTERNVAPQLALNASKTTATALSSVAVEVSADDGVRPLHSGSPYQLTTGGCFSGKTAVLASGAPEWASRVRVGDDGNIYLDVKPGGMVILFK